MLRILVVGGGDEAYNAMAGQLAGAGMAVHSIIAGAQLDEALAKDHYHIVISNVVLPDESGFSLAARLRLTTTAGLILLAATEKREDRILALSLGVDHYLAFPEDAQELVMLIENLNRRLERGASSAPAPTPQRAQGQWLFDAVHWTLTVPEGRTVSLSLAEHLMLGCLMSRMGEVVEREELLAALNLQDVRVYSRNIDMIISRLRRKIEKVSLEKFPVLSARGVGYVFTGKGKVLGDPKATSPRHR